MDEKSMKPGPVPDEPGEARASLLLAEEVLRSGKRSVVTGRVSIRAVTETIDQPVRHELAGETVEVVSVPMNVEIEPGAPAPRVRAEGDVTILPILEEVLVIEKRLILKEELHIIRRRTTEVVDSVVAVRRQRAVVERLGVDDAGRQPDPTEPDRAPQHDITAQDAKANRTE